MSDNEEVRETIAEFAARNGLTMTARDTGLAGGDWGGGHHRYACTIRKAGSDPLRVRFHMNPTAQGRTLPELPDVLNSLALDAGCFLSARDLDDFMAEFGSTDRKAASRTFEACRREADQLRRLLGSDELDRLLYHTEQL